MLFFRNVGTILGHSISCSTPSQGTRPVLERAGVEVLDAPFYAEGDVASAGGCLSAQYLATWLIWRALGKQAAIDTLSYVLPITQEAEDISRAVDAVSTFIPAEKYHDSHR